MQSIYIICVLETRNAFEMFKVTLCFNLEAFIIFHILYFFYKYGELKTEKRNI